MSLPLISPIILFDTFDDVPYPAMYILSHSHMDHTKSIRLKTSFSIRCTPETKSIVLMREKIDSRRHILNIVLVDDLYDSYVDDYIMVFRTQHSLGSIGVIDKHRGILYLGDGRLTQTFVDTVIRPHLSIVREVRHDDFADYPNYECDWPSFETSVTNIVTLLESHRHIAIIAHTDPVCILLAKVQLVLDFDYRTMDQTPVFIKNILDMMLVHRPEALRTITVIGRVVPETILQSDIVIVKPSLRHFILLSYCVHVPWITDGRITRVFFTTHSSPYERAQLDMIVRQQRLL